MELHPQEVVLLDSGDDPVLLHDFIEDRISASETLLSAHFTVARDWEPVETEGGTTINTTPNPTLKLFDTANGTVVVFCVEVADTPVHTAILAGHDDTEGMLTRAVESVEENFYGIKSVDGRSFQPDAHGLLDHIYDTVEEVTPDDD